MQYIKLGEVIQSAKSERAGDGDYLVLSITKSDGIVLQTEKFKKRIASQDTTQYRIVRKGQLVQGIHIDEANFGIQDIIEVGIVSPAYKIWDVNTSIIKPKYLEEVLRSPRSIQYYSSKFNGSIKRRERLSDKDFLEMVIPCPSIEEQDYVLAVIKKTREIIYRRQHEMLKLDELIKARFVEMFGDPVSNEKGWKTRPLLSMGSCKNGMNFHYDDSGVEINCLGVGDFKDHSVIADTAALSTVSLNEMPSSEYLLQDDDIVFVRSNGNKKMVGRSVAVYPGAVPTTFSGFCIRYRREDDSVITPYLLRVLKAESIRQKMYGRGANIQNLNQQTLSLLDIPVPPKAMQEQFAAFVAQADKSKSDSCSKPFTTNCCFAA